MGDLTLRDWKGNLPQELCWEAFRDRDDLCLIGSIDAPSQDNVSGALMTRLYSVEDPSDPSDVGRLEIEVASRGKPALRYRIILDLQPSASNPPYPSTPPFPFYRPTCMPPPLRPPNPLLTLRKNTTRHLSLPTSRPRRRPPPSTPLVPNPPSQPQPRAPAVPKPHLLRRGGGRFFASDARTALSVLFFLASWFPAYSFVSTHVVCVMSVTGPSMAPLFNTDHDGGGLASDRVWVNMWEAGKGLERGMVVVYRYVIT